MRMGKGAARLARVAAVMIVLTMLAGMAPKGTLAAQERGGGSYTSDDYGYTVSWDDAVWAGEVMRDADGVELSSDVSFVRIDVLSNVENADDCLSTSTDLMASSNSIEDFGKAPRRMERPETGAPASGLFLFVDAESGDEVIAHVECRELPGGGATLEAVLMAYEPDYAEALPSWNDLLQDLDRGVKSGGKPHDNGNDDNGSKGRSNRGNDAGVTGVDGNTYTDAEAGFSITLGRDWEMRELAPGEDIGKGIEVSSSASFGYITAAEFDGDLADCATQYAEGVGSAPNMARMKVAASTYERPKTARKAAGELYTFTLKTDGDSTKLIGYFECRYAADKATTIQIFVAAALASFDDELPVWEDLLGGVEVGGGSKSQDDNGSKGNTGNRGGDEPVEPAGANLVTPNFGVVVGYDDAVWSADDQSTDKYDIVQLQSDAGFGTVVAYGDPYDTKSCIELLIGLKVDESAANFDVAPASMSRPATSRDAAGELFAYTIQGDNGPIEVALYAECRPVAGGDATVGVTLLTVVDVWEAAVPRFEGLLAGVGESSEG